MSAVLALVLSLVMSPEAARARQGPMLFGSGQATFLVLGPAGPGDTLRMARVRVTHAELPESRSFDDAEYHLAVETPPNSRPGQVLTGTLWRFGAESPDGRKLSDGVRVEVLREDRIAPVMARGLAYRAMGTLDRLYLVHAGTGFAQILRVTPTLEEAAYWEAFFAATYGIPTACFHGVGRELAMGEEWLQRLYLEVDTASADSFPCSDAPAWTITQGS